MKQIDFPGMNPPCETGDLEHPIPTPLAVGEYLYYDDWVWMCTNCRRVAWPNT